MKRIVAILLGLILILGMLPVACSTVKLDDTTREQGLLVEIPFQLHGSMIVLEFSVDGSTPLGFIFDTAAGGTIISASTAAILGIVGDETVSREGATGTAPIILSEKHVVATGDLRFQNVTLGIAELDHIEKRLGMRIDGVIGWEILSQHAVRVNYDTMRLEIYDNKRFDYELSVGSYPIEVKGTVILTNITATFENGNTLTGKVMVDTGSGNTISFNTPFAEENNLLSGMDNYYERETQSLSTESSRIYTTMLADLSISDYKFISIPASIAIAETGAFSWSGIMGILGNDVLKRFNMFIDLQQRRMFLEPNQLYREAFEVNCSGVELVMDDTFQKVIADHVYVGSPAHEAGLKVGDEIVQIDGTSTSYFQLLQIPSMLSQDSKEVEIIVARKGELQSHLFRLQPLIE